MDFLKAKWTVLLLRKAIMKISFFSNRSSVQFSSCCWLKLPFTIFQYLLVLKPDKMSDPLFKNTQDNHYSVEHCNVECCQLLIVIIFKEMSAPVVTNALTVSLKFYLRMVWCSCYIRTCNMLTLSNWDTQTCKYLTRKLFTRLFITNFMINEGS